MERIICHIDCDAFFASVAQRENPELKGKPIAVGSTDRRGVVATASYEARKFGVRSAMPAYQAKILCPEIIFVNPDFRLYREASNIIMDIFKSYTPIVEIISIDEAYIDLTSNCDGDIQIAEGLVRNMKKEIFEATKLTVSAGISINKFLAKIASGKNKPDGLTIVQEPDILTFLDKIPIQDFRGVGKKTTEVMLNLGIRTGKDLRDTPLEELIEQFGDKSGFWFYNIARGIDDRPVDEVEYERKSVNVSETFQRDIWKDQAAGEALERISIEIFDRLKRYKMYGKTITVKVKFNDFRITTRSKTFQHQIRRQEDILNICLKLLKARPLTKPVRLFGISVSNFDTTTFPSLWNEHF